MNYGKIALCVAIGITLGGCASIPAGPRVVVMPASGKPFDQFQAENAICMDFARQQIGANPSEVARDQVLSGAVAGGALGAAAGALMGHGHAHAVEAGAGAGVLIGSAVGAGAAHESSMTLQRRYDIAYQQCMYAKGNQVPGYAQQSYRPPPPPVPSNIPPPPPGGIH